MQQVEQEARKRQDYWEREAFDHAAYCSCYVIGPAPDGPVKIGVAKDVVRRHNGMQVGCWTKLYLFDLLWFVGPPLALRVEAKALASMKAVGRYLRGEWFNEPAAVATQHLRLAAEGLNLEWFSETDRRKRTQLWQAKQIDALFGIPVCKK